MGGATRALQARWWLATLLCLLAACRNADTVPTLPRLDPEATILAFGDSLTYGTGATPDQAYPAVLAELIGRPVINAGIPGETTGEGLARLPEVLEQVQPALVILCLGGNDLLRRMDRKQMKQNLAAMIETLRSRGLPVVLLGVPEPRLTGLSTEASYRELAQAYGVPLEAAIIPDVLGDAARKSDGVHPNARGYADMATAIADLLRRAGAV